MRVWSPRAREIWERVILPTIRIRIAFCSTQEERSAGKLNERSRNEGGEMPAHVVLSLGQTRVPLVQKDRRYALKDRISDELEILIVDLVAE